MAAPTPGVAAALGAASAEPDAAGSTALGAAPRMPRIGEPGVAMVQASLDDSGPAAQSQEDDDQDVEHFANTMLNETATADVFADSSATRNGGATAVLNDNLGIADLLGPLADPAETQLAAWKAAVAGNSTAKAYGPKMHMFMAMIVHSLRKELKHVSRQMEEVNQRVRTQQLQLQGERAAERQQIQSLHSKLDQLMQLVTSLTGQHVTSLLPPPAAPLQPTVPAAAPAMGTPVQLSLSDIVTPVRAGPAGFADPSSVPASARAHLGSLLPLPVVVHALSGRTTAATFGAAHDAAERRLQLTTISPADATAGAAAAPATAAAAPVALHKDPLPAALPLSCEEVWLEYDEGSSRLTAIREVIRLYGDNWNKEARIGKTAGSRAASRWQKRWPVVKRVLWEVRSGGSPLEAAQKLDQRWMSEKEAGPGNLTLTKFVESLRGENKRIMDPGFFKDGVTMKGQPPATPQPQRRTRQRKS